MLNSNLDKLLIESFVFRISKIDTSVDREGCFRKYFTLLSKSETVLPCNKTTSILFAFEPTKEFELVAFPVFVCNFLENGVKENVISSFSIKVTVAVYLSK